MGQSLILRCWGNCCILYCLISIISGKSVFLLCNVFSDIFRICFTQMLDRTLERLYKDIQGNGVQVIAEWQQHPLWCFLSMVRTSPSPLPLSTYRNKTKKKKKGYIENQNGETNLCFGGFRKGLFQEKQFERVPDLLHCLITCIFMRNSMRFQATKNFPYELKINIFSVVM